MLAAADVMQLGAEAGSGILIPLPQGAALSASAMLQMEFGMDVLDAFGLGGGFTSVGGGAIRRTTTDAGATNSADDVVRVPNGPDYSPTTIGGRQYSSHAL